MHHASCVIRDAPRVTEHRATVNELKIGGEDLPLQCMLFCGVIGRLSNAKGNTAVLLGKMYHFILSDLVKSLLTLRLVRVEDPWLALAELCQTVFREASADVYPSP